jgi:hypothetical protein
VILVSSAAAAFERSLDLPLINAATAIGESRFESVRAQFHRPYRVQVAKPPVDYVDVVTPFRRIVQIAEDRARAGARPLGQRETLAAAGDRLGLVEIFVELTFHPMSMYVGVPQYDIELAREALPGRIPATQTNRVPRFGARVEGVPRPAETVPLNVPGRSEPMLGGTVIAGFAVGGLDPTAVYDVVISEKGKELARAKVNLASLR